MFISYLNSENNNNNKNEHKNSNEENKNKRNYMKIKNNVASIAPVQPTSICVVAESNQSEKNLTMVDFLNELQSIAEVSDSNNNKAQERSTSASSEENVDAFDDDAHKYADYSEEIQYHQHALVVNLPLTLPWQLDTNENNNSTDDSDTQLRQQAVRRVRRSSVGMQRRDAFRQRKLDSLNTWRHLR